MLETANIELKKNFLLSEVDISLAGRPLSQSDERKYNTLKKFV